MKTSLADGSACYTGFTWKENNGRTPNTGFNTNGLGKKETNSTFGDLLKLPKRLKRILISNFAQRKKTINHTFALYWHVKNHEAKFFEETVNVGTMCNYFIPFQTRLYYRHIEQIGIKFHGWITKKKSFW